MKPAADERRERGLAVRRARGRVRGLTRLVLDVDTGTDDAIAIMLAALDPRLELLAVATVAGNASIDHTTENSLRVLQHIGADVPVHRGAPGPLLPSTAVRDHPDAGQKIHGGYLDLPEARTTARDTPAARLHVETFDGSEITLVATGPLTNVATALRLDPGLAERIPRLVLMGGGHIRANATAAAYRGCGRAPFAGERGVRWIEDRVRS